MDAPFVGGEAVAAGRLTPYQLRSRHEQLFPSIFVPRGTAITARLNAEGAYRWAHGLGILAGCSAAAMHGTKYLDPRSPAEIIHVNSHPPKGIRCWADSIESDEIVTVDGMRITSAARTALDLASRLPTDPAITAIDALANATDLKVPDVELLADRYRGRRGIRKVGPVFELVDGGSQSPRETWLRLQLVRAGFPRPQTQIPVYDDTGYPVAFLDMGWEDVKVAVEYEGDQHRTDRRQFRRDIERYEEIQELGWLPVRVTAEDSPLSVVRRVGDARRRRGRRN